LAVDFTKITLPVDRSVNRPTVIFDPLAATGRPPGQPKQTESKPALSRSTVGSTGPTGSQRARICARRSTPTVDRLLGAVDRQGRLT